MFGWMMGMIAFAMAGYALDVVTVENHKCMVASLGYGVGIFGFIIGTLTEVKDKL